MSKLSIIIPAYNEIKTLPILLKKIDEVVLASNIEKEVIVVDDNSSDGTYEFLKNLENSIILIKHEVNLGKGAAVASGFKKATGDFVLIQDADLEYNPDDYNNLLLPILEGRAEVVYGSRLLVRGTVVNMFFLSYLSNKFLTWLSNVFTGMRITDMETGYKVFKREVIDEILPKLTSNRFGIEPEITSLVKKRKLVEVPISFKGRTFKDGKKISWKDGILAVWYIFYFNVWR